MRALREQLDRSRMDEREKSARLDLIAFQLGEIEKAAPRPGEDEELAATKQVLASAERIQRLCQESYATLYDSDDAVLAGTWRRVEAGRRTRDDRSAVRPVRRGARRRSNRSSRISHSSSEPTRTASTRRRAGCRRSRIGSPCSSD